jgi:hypothetical protein
MVYYKKTFWMNLIGAISWIILCLLNFAVDIDYVEHTLMHKIVTIFIQLGFLAILLVTARYLYKASNLLRKLTLISNLCGVIGAVLYVLLINYNQQINLFSWDSIAVLIIFSIFAVPCLINLKAVKVI